MYAMVCTRPDLAHAVGVVSRFLSNPDSDLAGNKDNMKSTSGYLMTFAGGAVSWQSRLQKCVALSTTEAEYVAATKACKELLWLKRFLQELGFKQQRYAVLCDNQTVFHRSPEFAPSDRHDFWTEVSLHIKEGFDRWDLDFEA
ncbi:hypothetical protein Tco_0272091, partial [Tanacetum coccineum]